MKKGFTLVELLASLIVLAIISLIAFPVVNNVIKKSDEKLHNAQLQEIKEATEKWAYLNIDLLPDDGESITVTILELKKSGFLPLDIRNPKTKELLPNDMQVIIENKNNIYNYIINEESGTNIKSEVNENSPILILNGSPIEYVEFGSDYVEKGALAKDKSGNTLNDINIVYQHNGVEIGDIKTNDFKTYTIIYSVSSKVNGNVYTSNITRTLVVRDTTEPVIEMPSKIDITLSEARNYNEAKLLEDVIITDNSNDYDVTISGFDASVGQKIVSYTACDKSNNCLTKKRIINITE